MTGLPGSGSAPPSLGAAGLVSAARPAPVHLATTDFPSFTVHPAAWIAILAMTAGYAVAIRQPRFRVTRRQGWSFLGAMAVSVVASTWPLADLAAHRLLVALVVQRLALLLAAPPLLIGGLPQTLVAVLTRPAPVDAVARLASKPIPAVVIVTVVAVGTLVVPVVDAQSSSPFVRALLDALLLGAGLVLWAPVLHPVPGTGRLSAFGTAGYLVVQSILPSFLSIVWIFARHPLYPAYTHHGQVLHLSPLLDQQLSGFVAKLGTIFVLWTVAFVAVSRSERMAGTEGDPGPLTWADVERQLERVARRERRGAVEPRERVAPPFGGGPGAGHRHRGRRRREEHGKRDDPAGGEQPGAG